MRRVLLFVPWPKGPKVAKSFGESKGMNRARAAAYTTKMHGTWWLVECWRADQGRLIIAAGEYNRSGRLGGRVLAFSVAA